GKTLLHGDVLMWLMKTLLTSGCTNQRGAGQAYKYSMKVYKSNEDKSPFCNVREMTDTVQNYYHEYGGNDTCPLCTKHIDD
ncbi:hypothetical protein Q7I52_23345, partial [Escherichia coli]|uniref:hypothetical protein n=1 Tax=Escherichia coli TaxID=562 RepID=UPI003EE5BA2C